MAHYAMYTKKVSLEYNQKTDPKHYRSSTILNSGEEVLFHTFVLCFIPTPPGMFAAETFQVLLKQILSVEVPL